MKHAKQWMALAGVGLVVVIVAVLALPVAAAGIDRSPVFHRDGPGLGAGGEALAEALGITVEELQAAQKSANEAALQQAVDEGLLTQEQADSLLERGGTFGRFQFHGSRGFLGRIEVDQEALLAESLGISVDKLQIARDAAMKAQLDQAVEDGRLTEAQADMLRAGKGLRSFLDQQNFWDSVRSLYEETVQKAVESGVITQEQADAILSNGMDRFGGMRGLPGMRGMRGDRFHGMPGFDGLRRFRAPSETVPGGFFQRPNPGRSGVSL